MKLEYTRGALGVVLCGLVALPAFAQQAAPQPPAAGTATPAASPASCAQSSQAATRGIDVLGARIEEARQSNDAAKLRSVVADVEVALAQMKTLLAGCTSLTAESGAMANMAGNDHSKMQMPPGPLVMQPGSTVPAPGARSAAPMAGMDHSKMQMPSKPAAKTGAAAEMDHSKMGAEKAAPAAKTHPTEPSKMAGMDHSKMPGEKVTQAPTVIFTLRTEPAPLRMGKNDFEVSVKDAEGKPIADAEVSLAFYMPPMTSGMPEMRNAVKLTSAGNGTHRGSSTLGMAGDWDVTVTASRNGRPLEVKKMKLVAK